MKQFFRDPSRVTLYAAVIALTSPVQVEAYPIDCAILLCLSGGWPASAECTAARTVFIRRITPWPVEPPLQIWRCPMGGADLDDGGTPATRFAEAAEEFQNPDNSSTLPAAADPMVQRNFESALAASLANSGAGPAQLLRTNLGEYINERGRADVDISNPDFDFVRSIRVYDVFWVQYQNENSKGDRDCRQPARKVRVGTYGSQGDFRWSDVPVETATAETWMGFTTVQDETCTHTGRFRGIAVEWRDFEGHHGYEVVRY